MQPEHIDALLSGTDLLNAHCHAGWCSVTQADIDAYVERLNVLLASGAGAARTVGTPLAEPPMDPLLVPTLAAPATAAAPEPEAPFSPLRERRVTEGGERVLRVTAERLNGLLDMSSKSLVETQRLKPLLAGMQQASNVCKVAATARWKCWVRVSARQVRRPMCRKPWKLVVELSDDGGGVDLDRLRQNIVERKLSPVETAEQLSEEELLSFLFLPGFSMRDKVTQISGRGVGLDAVQHMVRQMHGGVELQQWAGEGSRFRIEMPLTLSVVRSLVVEVGGEAYAFPLAHIERMRDLQPDEIVQLEGRQHFWDEERHVGLVSASQLLNRPPAQNAGEALKVVVIRERDAVYGVAVERFIGERTLVVMPLDARLGKEDVSAGALLDDGSVVLIIDVEDMLRSVEKLLNTGRLERIDRRNRQVDQVTRKRVLVVDDSLTVRELERKLLVGRGYEVAVAVDGMDGWNALRAEDFDLLITDIDMPRMDGIELVTLLRRDTRLQSLPVMVVSYKDREEDRRRGLDAGADYYLAKASFHDDALLDAVVELIGDAQG